MESWNPYLYGFYLSFLIFTNDDNEEVEISLCQQASFYVFRISFHDL
jgi:hypothetical protein